MRKAKRGFPKISRTFRLPVLKHKIGEFNTAIGYRAMIYDPGPKAGIENTGYRSYNALPDQN